MIITFTTQKLATKKLFALIWNQTGNFLYPPTGQFIPFVAADFLNYVVPVVELSLGIFIIEGPDSLQVFQGAYYQYSGVDPTEDDVKNRLRGVFFVSQTETDSEGIGSTEVLSI